MTTVHTLASGSSGNALLLSCGATHLLVDAGISCRRITTALKEVGVTPGELTAILITHTHSDHISGLQVLLKKTVCPVCAPEKARWEIFHRFPTLGDRFQAIEPSIPHLFGNFSITSFPTSHDAPGSCGYRFDAKDGSVGLMTDTGYVTDEAAEILPGVDLAILEANHDIEAVRSGPYPYYLKQRILGDWGHLPNEAAARFAVTLAENGASEIILAHLSRENNTPAMARNAVEAALSAAGLSPELSVAPRDCLSAPHTVCRRAVCRK